MKLTWFGGTTIRIHIGGKILVADSAGVSGVDPEELVSGADATFALDGSLPEIDPVLWQPARPGLDAQRRCAGRGDGAWSRRRRADCSHWRGPAAVAVPGRAEGQTLGLETL